MRPLAVLVLAASLAACSTTSINRGLPPNESYPASSGRKDVHRTTFNPLDGLFDGISFRSRSDD